MNGDRWLADVTKRFRDLRSQCDGALAQVPFERWAERLDPEANSIVTLMLHLSGNMRSRWTDFLASDGEKPDRDRDAEFEDASLGREELLARWESGWDCLLGALAGLTDADLERTILIRAEPHAVFAAIDRQLAHYAVHTGQLVLLAKHIAGPSWESLSVPRGGSRALNASMMGTGPDALRTERLLLVPGSIALYEEELAAPERLGLRLRAQVPAGWPPGEHDRSALEFFLAREREEGPAASGWYAWYVVWRGGAGEPDTLAGSAGYFGPPREGTVEIGYSVVESWRGRGIATETIAAMTARAFAVPGVARVVAHTAEDNAPSQAALRRAGFHEAGPGTRSGMRRFERLAGAPG